MKHSWEYIHVLPYFKFKRKKHKQRSNPASEKTDQTYCSLHIFTRDVKCWPTFVLADVVTLALWRVGKILILRKKFTGLVIQICCRRARPIADFAAVEPANAAPPALAPI